MVRSVGEMLAGMPEAGKISKVCHLTPNFVQSGALKSTE